MKAASRFLAVSAVVLAGALVFSPLVWALCGSGLSGAALAAAWTGSGRRICTSIGIASVAGLAALLIGTPFALLVERASPALRRVCWGLGLAVLMVPPYIVSESWIVLLGPAGKLSRPIAAMISLGPRSTDPLEVARFTIPPFIYGWPTAGLLMGVCLFPIVALAVSSAYRRTDHRVFESARVIRGRVGVLSIGWRILFLPAVGGALLVFAAALTEFAVPQQLRARTLNEPIYELIQEGDFSTAAELSLAFLPIVLCAGALGAVMLARSRGASLAGLEGEVPKFTGKTGGGLPDSLAVGITLLAMGSGLILTAVSLIWLAVAAKLPPPSVMGRHKLLRASGFVDSMRGAWSLAHDDAIRTVVFATVAATLATLVSIGVVRLAARISWGPVVGCLCAGLAVPPPIVGLGIKALWDHDPTRMVSQGWAIVMFEWFARFLPIVLFLVQGALARVPRELESAAALSGRRPLDRFISVVLPSALPGIIAAWLAMYVLCTTEYGATVVVEPPGLPFLAPSIINLMRRGQDPEIAACQLLLLAAIALPLAPLAVASLWWRRKKYR